MIGEQRAVRAFMRAEDLVRGSLKVEERPVAVRLRLLVAMNRFPPHDRLANLLENELAAAGLPVQRVPEAALWRLFAHPPRPRLAGRE
jgi:hypothetical protein